MRTVWLRKTSYAHGYITSYGYNELCKAHYINEQKTNT